jgi:hypothetical protein
MGDDGSRGAGMLTAHPDRPNQSHRPERSTAVCSDLSVGVLVLSVVDPGGGGPGATQPGGHRGLGKYPWVVHRGLVMQLNGAVTDTVVR